MHPDKPPYFQQSQFKKWLVIGLFFLPTIIALVEIARGVLFGFIYKYGYRGNGRYIVFEWGDPDAMITLLWYVVMALFLPGASWYSCGSRGGTSTAARRYPRDRDQAPK